MEKPLIIGYGGELKYFSGVFPTNSFTRKLRKWFFTYQIDNIIPETRSGYFLFKLIKHLVDKQLVNATNLQIHIWGLIEKRNEGQIKELGIDHIVKIGGYMNKKENIAKLNSCDVLFLPLESGKNKQNPLFIPGKLFEYLSIGKPILAFTGTSDAKNILIKSGLAKIADPFNMEECEDALMYLMNNKRSLNKLFFKDEIYIKEQFDFDNLTKKLADIFDRL